MYGLHIRLHEFGGLFDERAHRIFHDFSEELDEEAADFALGHIKDTYHTHFKEPTGYYESRVRVHKTPQGTEVWDGGHAGPAYGPWLEGVGSRNATTRFKGYWAFKKAAAALESRIRVMGDLLFDRHYRDEL